MKPNTKSNNYSFTTITDGELLRENILSKVESVPVIWQWHFSVKVASIKRIVVHDGGWFLILVATQIHLNIHQLTKDMYANCNWSQMSDVWSAPRPVLSWSQKVTSSIVADSSWHIATKFEAIPGIHGRGIKLQPFPIQKPLREILQFYPTAMGVGFVQHIRSTCIPPMNVQHFIPHLMLNLLNTDPLNKVNYIQRVWKYSTASDRFGPGFRWIVTEMHFWSASVV